MRIHAFFAISILSNVVHANYFTDTAEVKNNRILIGGGIRQEAIGITYERKISQNYDFEGSLGFFSSDGIHLVIGANRTWCKKMRIRPKAFAGLGYVSGIKMENIHMKIDNDTSTFSQDSKPGISLNLMCGIQYRAFSGIGAEWNFGYKQMLAGGGYTVTSTGNGKNIEDLIKATAGNGLILAGRGFVEF